MADWQAFATAFLTDTAGYIKERKDKAADYEDKLREDKERNRERVQRKQLMMNSAQSITSNLKELGATEELIRSAMASGPTGLTDLNRAFQEASTKFGPNFARENPNIVSEIARTSATPEALGMTGENKTTLDEFMRQTYGLSDPTPESYEAGETSLLGRLMGYGAKDQARARLDKEIAYDGYSYLDLQEAARASEYTSLVPGSSVQYGAPNVFNSDSMRSEVEVYQRILSNVTNTPQYASLEARAKAAQATIDKRGGQQADGVALLEADAGALAAAKQVLQETTTEMLDLRRGAVQDLVTQRGEGFFGDTYFDVMEGTIDTLVNDKGFTASLIASRNQDEPAQDGTTRPTDDSMAPPSGTPEGVTTPEQGTDVLPSEQGAVSNPSVLGGSPVIITLNEAGEETIRTTQPMVGKGGVVVPAGTLYPVEAAAPLIEALRAPERNAARVAEATPISTELTPEVVEATRESLGVAPITREEYDAMSRSEKRALGLTTSIRGRTREFSGEFLAPTFNSSLEIKTTADPDTFYEVYLPHFAQGNRRANRVEGNRTYRVKGSDLKYIPDARLAAEQSTVIINGVAEEGADLSTISGKRLQRKYGEYQEPVSSDPTAQAVETSGRPTERPEGLSRATLPTRDRFSVQQDELNSYLTPLQEALPIPTERPEGPTEDFYEQLDATTEVDAMTDSLLKSSGTDMLGYLREKGLTKDADAASMLSALGEWAAQNNKDLPLNKESLLYAMRFGLNL